MQDAGGDVGRMQYEMLVKAVVAGLLASLACGLGALPLMLRGIDPEKHTGLGYAFAGGLMFSASVYNLILPGLTLGNHEISLRGVVPVLSGILLGCGFLWLADTWMSPERFQHARWSGWGGRTGMLIFLAMSVHSIPEGVAVGVGYASEQVYSSNLGSYIALAIALHNIPEGLAVAIPLRAGGASIPRCFIAAFLTSLPQPIAAVPACILSWVFTPLMPIFMGFAAGAMMYLVLLEIIPQALSREQPTPMAWTFMFGFCGMLLIQVLL
jgi:ZIP family zinc transporter